MKKQNEYITKIKKFNQKVKINKLLINNDIAKKSYYFFMLYFF